MKVNSAQRLHEGGAKHTDSHNNSIIDSDEAPFSIFTLSMDKVRYTSFKVKLWEDKQYKLER